ncbi:UDP-3-O-acyl-N-acetylglucosamine deacetylase [Pelagibacteraceae bacterium]|nr:UDP-3-O-acyl-N-acetylglucosamine deacetylase [Pelagibacteraceae bacterium]
MLNVYQHTIDNIVSFKGIGLHSGKISNVKLVPAKENQGIIFKRTDLKENNIIKANYNNVTSAKLCTTLENSSGSKVSTVEHLLASFYILGIDNVIIEIDNEEVPIMDGSSKDFIKMLNKTGLKKLDKRKKFLKILKRIELEDGDRKISIEPSNFDFEVNFELNYSNKIIGKQKNNINFFNSNLEDIYSSRTFCLFQDIEKIKKSGLAKGGSLENAVVVNDEKVINEEGLRNNKEFVNHKILDLAGDFLLSGYSILGKVDCHQGGHQLSNTFLRKLLKSKEAYTEIELNDIELPKKAQVNQIVKLAVNA